MKIILSRKGFDSSNGGIPSPILPDGTMLSMPIPSEGDRRTYNDLRYNNSSYRQILTELTGKDLFNGTECHLDPDIRKGCCDRPDGWKPSFGQIGAAEGHLENQRVGIGDLFLYFGWFRHTTVKNGKLTFIGPATGFHAIYGYLQVGKIIRNEREVPGWLLDHPHATGERWQRNNSIYIASDSFSLEDGCPGSSTLKFSQELVLTKAGYSRSVWSLPDYFKNIQISYNSSAWKGDEFHSAAKGQEFVFEANPHTMVWAKSLIINNKE